MPKPRRGTVSLGGESGPYKCRQLPCLLQHLCFPVVLIRVLSTDHVTPLSASRSLLQCPEASPAAAKVSWLLRCKDLRIYLPWLLLAMPRTSGRQRQHKKVPSKYHCQCVDSESHREFQGGLCYLLTHVSSDNSLEPLVPSLMGWGKRA